MNELWTNSNLRSDFVRDGLLTHCATVTEVYIAVAFFTESEIIKKIISDGRHVRMVVRLGYPTVPKALQDLIGNPNVEIRYYSASSFHPKLYIFGGEAALVGSANLTGAAVISNQEIVVSIGSEDPRFDDLVALFSNYWQEAKVLDQIALDEYAATYKKYSSAIAGVKEIDRELQEKIGKTEYQNIGRDVTKRTERGVFTDSYKRSYQEWVAAFDKVREIYISTGKGKGGIATVPLRIEIDAFVSFVRETHVKGESWKEPPVGWSDERKQVLLSHIHDWIEVDWPYYETICNERYPLIEKTLKSHEAIQTAEYDEIVDALVVLHSFHDRLRFFPGGLDTLRQAFKEENELDKVKNSLSHLLFGGGDVIARMADLIYEESYKLRNFGQSNVQELIGWVNNDDLPVVNGRTTKVLRFYGLNVSQI